MEAEKAMIHVVGAGISGLACGVKLARNGYAVHFHEAATHAGGRCRSYHDSQLNMTIDNGNHLILRQNEHTLNYIRTLKTQRCFYPFGKQYSFLDISHHMKWRYRPPYIPKGFRIPDIWRLLRLLFVRNHTTVSEIFPESTPLFRQFIEPICTAMLNTHPSTASAQQLRYCLLRLLIPKNGHYLQVKTSLDDALIAPALSLIEEVGGSIECNQRLTGGEAEDGRLTKLLFSRKNISLGPRDLVIFALPPDAVTQLLPITVPEDYNQIVNAHFRYDTSDIKERLLGLVDNPTQWIFIKENLISTTTSDAENSALRDLSQAEKASVLWKNVTQALQLPESPLPPCRIIAEKRATISATPKNLAKRAAMKTMYHNLVLAGDWLKSPLPATIEASIQSGNAAADWCLRRLKA